MLEKLELSSRRRTTVAAAQTLGRRWGNCHAVVPDVVYLIRRGFLGAAEKEGYHGSGLEQVR
ncbi:MAG TPA: hypothetical protein ENN66_02830 [Proteobacteria bacterium]|nr:hypothetical protein [Pseudomonadota bacterium]